MTATELRDLIVRQLVKNHGGATARWRRALGEIRVYPLSTHAHCNWDAWPTGPGAEVSLIEAMVDRLRTRYPIVAD